MVVALSGCFSMGLPEYFAGGSLGLERQIGVGEGGQASFTRGLLGAYDAYSPVVLVISEPAPAEAEPHGLGHQFLFGIFPITYVYLQHAQQSLIAELLLDTLQENGFTPILVSSADLKQSFDPDLVLRPSLPTLRVNAYDAFFFRIISLQGEIGLGVEDRHGEIVEQRHSISTREYRSHAHAPLLSSLLERSIRDKLRELVAALPRRHQQRGSEQSVLTPVLLTEPTFIDPPPTSIGVDLAASYGFDFTPPFSFASVRRVIQRGMEDGSRAEGLPYAALRGEWSPSKLRAGNWWLLRSGVSKLELRSRELEQEAVKLAMEFTLETRDGHVLSRASCAEAELLATGVDGALVVTVERAAKALAQAFLSRKKGLCVFTDDSLESLNGLSSH